MKILSARDEESNETPDEISAAKVAYRPDNIRILQFSVYFLLCSLVAGIGSATFLFIRNSEYAVMMTEFTSTSSLIKQRVFEDISKKAIASDLMNHLFAYADEGGYGGTFPNITLPGFELTMNAMRNLADLRFVNLCPLISNDTRSGFEHYAKVTAASQIELQSLNISQNGITDFDNKRVSGYIKNSTYPTLLLPIWQTAPISTGYTFVMVDIHSLGGSRTETIDIVLSTKEKRYTDLIVFTNRDRGIVRPSTLLFSPILSLKEGNPVIGLFAGGFSWDIILRNATLEAITIVLETSTQVFSYATGKNGVTTLGEGKKIRNESDNFEVYVST